MTGDAESAISENAEDLLRYFRRRVGSEVAPDLLAETLATAWRRARLIPAEPESARMWLYGIARNTLRNFQRGERRRARLADKLRSVLHTATPEPDHDALLSVRDAIDRLDPHLAELVRLVHWEGMTLVQAAILLQIPPSTARGQYQRAKQQLRATLESDESQDQMPPAHTDPSKVAT